MSDLRRFNRGILFGALLLISTTGIAMGEEAMLQPGEEFVAFKLTAHDGSTVDSADLEGRPFLLFFYPKASTPG
jgi:cytochrome oxidase Cu insertion factor (SCO1/SenC/PrrC family)